ncbi:unnamed protein product [Symbiodinium sp. CCMP2592]|nr:unnamed protein product [Symbiodinium sp. CCMP2592]
MLTWRALTEASLLAFQQECDAVREADEVRDVSDTESESAGSIPLSAQTSDDPLLSFHQSHLAALDIPFKAIGASEPNATFRAVAQQNFEIQHMHGTMQEQIEGRKCLRHEKCSDVSCCPMEACDLCVFGTPCNPFSDLRMKRYRDDSVARHPLAEVTFRDAKSMIVQGDHRCIIMEQVAGFDKMESGSDTLSTPMRRHVGGISQFL